MTLEGIVQNGVIVPHGKCALPDGTKVRIEVVHRNGRPKRRMTIGAKLAELGKRAELRESTLPADLAENHDHYIHGRPKRS